jgi:ribosomal-protein-alanine N-acetyltransferase
VTPPVAVYRAEGSDLGALAELEVACFSHPWTPAQVSAEIAAGPPGAFLVLRGPGGGGGGTILGYCAYRLAVDEAEILTLAVHPAWRRRGLARRLLHLALDRAARAGARRALLEVRASNEAALAAYSALGFERLGTRRDYYREPLEDALVLGRDCPLTQS